MKVRIQLQRHSSEPPGCLNARRAGRLMLTTHPRRPSCQKCDRPTAVRWLNRDPFQELGGINLYEFVGNNPVDFVDTDGRYKFGWSFLAGVAARVGVYVVQQFNNARCPSTGDCQTCCNLTAAALGVTCAATAVAGGLVTGGMFGSIPIIGVITGPLAGIASGAFIAGECGRDVAMGRQACLAGCPCKK
jgi:hypothetical protein